jgi:uncharacterized protein (TIGR02246 family)
MRKSSLAVFLTGLLFSAAGAAADGTQAGASAVDARWLAAMKANDLAAILACYSPDAVMWLPGAPEARGAKAIREAYSGLLSANTVQDASLANSQYQTSRDLSAGWGDFVVTLQPKAGGPPTFLEGRFTAVAKRLDGRWVYVADHASSGPSAP